MCWIVVAQFIGLEGLDKSGNYRDLGRIWDADFDLGILRSLQWRRCRGGGMVDAADLKSAFLQRKCGFESLPRQ